MDHSPRFDDDTYLKGRLRVTVSAADGQPAGGVKVIVQACGFR
ncbi:MAG: hypothetical protein AB1705_16385 [Verrucomicrobiota bacterium]